MPCLPALRSPGAAVARAHAPALALAAALVLAGCPSEPASSCPRTCAAGLELCCGGACVGILSDAFNCGRCGNVCLTGACVMGVCSTAPIDAGPRDAPPPPRDGGICPGGMGTRTCPSGIVNCSGYTGAADSDGRSDPSFTNCGACGVACDPVEHNRCATPGGGLGTPRCLCGASNCGDTAGDMCTLVSGAYRCIRTGSDPMNCGAVGNVCGAAEVCAGGMCVCNAATREVCDAAAGETCCGGACVDLTSDEAHCGRCGMACPADEECVTAAGGPSACLCGGVECDAAETCMAGSCVCNTATGEVCGAGESCCGGTCIDTSADPVNCGGCGVRCGANTTCSTVGGVTGCFCGTDVCAPVATTIGMPAGELCCDDGSGTGTSHCVTQDAMNCRECGRACPGATDTCRIAAPSPGDPPGARPCCSSDIIPIFGFCSDDFGG